MKKYGKIFALISGVYLFLTLVSFTLAYAITKQAFYGAYTLLCATLFSPIYTLILGILFCIDTSRRAKTVDVTPNVRFERKLSIFALSLSIASVLARWLPNHKLSPGLPTSVVLWVEFFCGFACVGAFTLLLDRFITKLILKIARKKNPDVSADCKGVITARVCLLAAGFLVLLIIAGIILFFEAAWVLSYIVLPD